MGRRRPKKRPPTPSESSDEAGEASMFPVGAEVEVRSDDPGFEGSFYETTVAGHLISRSGRGRWYTLAYSTLLAEEGGRLKETAAAADVRPRPPPGENARTGFAICDMVEAFHNEGWWAGVVSAVPPPTVTGDRPRGVYKVTFPTSRETMEFEETALRPHRVFKDGRWVPAAEVDNGSPLFSEGNRVEVRQSAQNFGGSWSPATVSKVIGAKHFLVQYTHIKKNGELATEIVHSRYIRPACVITHMDSRHRFSPSSHIEVFHQGGWWPGVVVEVSSSGINKKYVVRLKNHKTDREHVGVLTVENTQLRLRYDWVGKKWVRCLKEKPAKGSRLTARKRPISAAKALYGEGDGSCRDKKLKKADVASESFSPLLSDRNEEDAINHMSCSYPEETMEQQNGVLALGSQLSLPSLPSMTALGHLSPSSLIPSCHLEQSSQMIIEPYTPRGPYLGTRSHNSDWSKIVLTDQENQSSVGSRTDLSRQKEECGAFQKADAPGESAETAKKGIAAKTIEEDDDIITIFEDLGQLPNDMIAGCEILSEMNTGSCIDLTPRKDIRGSQERSGIHDLQQGGYSGETGVEQDTGEDLCQDTSLAALEGDKVLTESPSKEFSDSSQSIEKTVTRISSVRMSTCTETEPGNSSALVIRHLPFVKTSPLWAQLEAREIFSKVPQRPHFQLLQHHCPQLREGMAFGLMSTFSLLAENINRLEVQDENGLLEERMEVLSLLEANGFDVRDLKSRLEALLDAKNSRVELQDAMNKLEELIAKKETEDRELSTEIRMLATTLHQLDLHAYIMRDMMRSAISQKAKNAMEISKLKTEANKLDQSYVSMAAPR
ncbi:unnamed protein product [Alopecurus aequalis]